MGDDFIGIVVAKNNYEQLYAYDIVLGFNCVLPMLEAMQSLSKFAQGINTFVQYFMTFIIVITIDLYAMYMDLLKRYDHPQF
jgi:hypothetical protein